MRVRWVLDRCQNWVSDSDVRSMSDVTETWLTGAPGASVATNVILIPAQRVRVRIRVR